MKEDNLDYNLAQIFLNDHTNTIGINQLLLGDEAYSIEDHIAAIKRAKMQNIAGPNAGTIIHDDKLGVEHRVDIIKQFLFQDELVLREFETIIEADRGKEATEGERTDGQMYITLKALRYFLFGFGKLNVAKAEILNKIARGEMVEINEEFFGNTLSPSWKEQGMILNSMKLAYGDGKTYLKMSAATLTPELTSVKRNGVWVAREGREKMHNLRMKLENYEQEQWENGVGVLGIAVPASASKMMKVNMQTTDTAFNDSPLTDDMTTELEAEHMRLQVINPSNKIEIVDPRQIKNLITSEQDDSIEVSISGIRMTIGEVKAMYRKNVSDRVANEYFKRRNLVFTWGGALNEMIKAKDAGQNMSVNLSSFLKYAIKGLESAQTKAQMMDYFQMDEFGEPQYELNNQMTIRKFQELFMAFFNKGVLSERQPGISAALMSDAGFQVVKKVEEVDENGVPIRWTVIRSNDWEGMITLDPNLRTLKYTDPVAQTFSGLSVRENNKPVYYLDHLRSNVMEYDENGMATDIRYTEMMIPPHFKSILDNAIAIGESIPDAIAKMFGIRIPSQDKHSSVNLKVVDWLPVYMGSTAIFSRDLVEISGADFDIDKLYMQIKDFYVRNGEFIEYGSATNEKEAYQDYIKFTLREYGKKNGSLYMAVEEFLRREKSIENAERIGIDKTTANMNPIKKRQFLDQYLKDKKLRLKVELFDLLTHDTTLSVDMEIKLYNRAEGLAEGMRMLGLPVTEKEYNEYKEKYGREPYRGAQDNKILDAKFGLLGNPGMTDPRTGRITGIASEPAVLTPLTDKNATGILGEGVWEYIQRELPELAEELGEEGIDINNITGKMISWDNNKEGARSIGAVVRPNLLVNILQEYGITLRTKIRKGEEIFPRLKLNGSTKYDNFGVEYTINPLTGKEDASLHRKQFVISALVTAMTDNAKERLAKKLGLSKGSLSVVTTMLALGVDIKTTVLLIKHPTIANAFEQSKRTKKGPVGLLKARRSAIKKIIEVKESKAVGDFDITTESLTRMNKHFNAINDGIPKLDRSESAILVGLPSEDQDGWTIEELKYDLNAIEQYLTAAEISEAIREMSNLVDLQKGWGRDLEAMQDKQDSAEKLGLLMTKKEFEDSMIPVNVRDIFLKPGGIHYTNYQMFREGYDIVAPQLFIERTKPFEKMYNTLLNNLNSNVFFTKGKKKALSVDLITYLNTKSYVYNIAQNSFQSWQGASLQNGMIYEHAHFPAPKVKQADGRMVSPEALNVATVVKGLRKYVAEELKSTNYFMDNYISLIETDSENNNTGSTQVVSNTWTRVDDAELTRIQNSLLELYQDPNTHKEVIHLINYLLVKDGFQYRPNTFLSAIPADLTKDILNTIGPIHQLFKSSEPQESQFIKLFGLTYEELFNDFLEGYMSSTRMDYYLKSTKIGGEISVYNTEKIVIPERSILIDWDTAESSSNSQVLSNLAPRVFKFKYQNKEYEFGSVIHAFQVLRQGKFDKRVNKAYTKEGIANAHGKTIETKMTKKRGFNSDALLKQLIRASFMQKDVAYTVNGIGIRNELTRYSDFTFMTNDKISKVTREGLLDVQRDMVYNNKENGEQTIISKAGIKAQERKNSILVQQPMVRNTTEKTLVVNAFKGVNAKYTEKVKVPIKAFDLSKWKKGDETPLSKLIENLGDIKKGGFRIVSKIIKVKGEDKTIAQIAFPFIIKNSVGQGRSTTDIKYYKLIKLYPDGKMPIDINAFEMMDSEENIALGNLAVYTEIDQFGSISQNATGFALPGHIPTKTEIEAYLEEKNNIFAEDNIDVEDVEEEFDIEDVTPEEQDAKSREDGTKFFSENEDPIVDLEETEIEEEIGETRRISRLVTNQEYADLKKAEKEGRFIFDEDGGRTGTGRDDKYFVEGRYIKEKIDETETEEVDVDDIVVEEEDKLADGGTFFSNSSIASQAKANPADSKLENAWDKLTPEERFSAANIFKLYSAEDLIAKYNTTNNRVSISVTKFMENLKCGL